VPCTAWTRRIDLVTGGIEVGQPVGSYLDPDEFWRRWAGEGTRPHAAAVLTTTA
jgi:hypothetical protein